MFRIEIREPVRHQDNTDDTPASCDFLQVFIAQRVRMIAERSCRDMCRNNRTGYLREHIGDCRRRAVRNVNNDTQLLHFLNNSPSELTQAQAWLLTIVIRKVWKRVCS